jgi:hypothetical protein
MHVGKVTKTSAVLSRCAIPVGTLIRSDRCTDDQWARALAAIDVSGELMRCAKEVSAAVEGLVQEVENERIDVARFSRLADRETVEEESEVCW